MSTHNEQSGSAAYDTNFLFDDPSVKCNVPEMSDNPAVPGLDINKDVVPAYDEYGVLSRAVEIAQNTRDRNTRVAASWLAQHLDSTLRASESHPPIPGLPPAAVLASFQKPHTDQELAAS